MNICAIREFAFESGITLPVLQQRCTTLIRHTAMASWFLMKQRRKGACRATHAWCETIPHAMPSRCSVAARLREMIFRLPTEKEHVRVVYSSVYST